MSVYALVCCLVSERPRRNSSDQVRSSQQQVTSFITGNNLLDFPSEVEFSEF